MKSLITVLLLGLFISSQAQNISQSQVRQFNAVPAYRVFGRGAGVGTPSFITLDSNHVPQLHSQGYYDGRYGSLSVQNTNTSNISANTTAIGLKVDKSSTITINGTSQTFGSNPSFTVSGGGTGSLSMNDSLKVSQSILNKYVSNIGSDINTGTNIDAPKNTLVSAATGLASNQTIKMESGSSFNEAVNLSTAGLRQVTFEGYHFNSLGRYSLPIVTGATAENTGWTLTSGTSSTYQQDFVNNTNAAVGAYSYIYPIEIDTAIEKIYPFTARKYLTLVASQAAVETTAGSFFIPSNTNGGATLTMYIHPTSGVPGRNTFRYEVTNKNQGFAAQVGVVSSSNTNGLTVRNAVLRDNINGYGFAGGDSTLLQNVILQGGAIHQAVIFNGIVDKTLWLPTGKNMADLALVFYRPVGLQEKNRLSNSVSIDIKKWVYSHTSGGANHRAIEFNNNWSWADTTNAGSVYQAENNDSVFMNNIYANGAAGIYYGLVPNMVVKNSVINNASYVQFLGPTGSGANPVGNWIVDNSFIKLNGNDYNSNGTTGVTPSIFSTPTNLKTTAQYSTFILRAIGTANSNGGASYGANNSDHCIIVADVNGTNPSLTNGRAVINQGNATQLNYDYNVYIILRGGFGWGQDQTFAQWQTTGKDTHSKLIDLSSDPRGLKAIFTNPEAGDYTLISGGWGDTVRAMGAGMRTPVRYFPAKPSYEQAAEWITQDRVPLVSSLFFSGGSIPNAATLLEGTNKLAGYDGSNLTNVQAAAAGSTNQVQYKSGTFLAASPNFTFDPTTTTVTTPIVNATTNVKAGTGTTFSTLAASSITATNSSIFSISAGGQTYSLGSTSFTAPSTVTAFTPLPTYLNLSRTSGTTDIQGQIASASISQNLRLSTADHNYNASGTLPGNIYVFAGKNTTTNVNGYTILGHDGTNKRGTVGIGGSTMSGAALTVNSQYEGVLLPRLTTSQRDSLYKTISVASFTPGSGYTNLQAVSYTLSGGGGSGLVITGNMNSSGQLASATVSQQGYGYSSAPTVTVTNANGSGATITLQSTVQEGMEIYNLTTHTKQYWNGTVWKNVITD